MDHNVNFDLTPHHMEAGLESPVDEEGVHDSFNQLIEDQRQEAFELQELQRELDEEERDSVAYLSSPGREIWRGGQGRGEEGEEGRQLDPLIEERWSSATLRVLSSMPSRTIGRSRGAIISQYCNKTMKLRRRRQSRPSIKDFSRSARPSIRGYGVETGGVETDGVDGEGRKRDHLVNNLQNLSLSDRVRMLRAMPLSVAEKSELRRLADRKGLRSKHSQIPCCSQLKYNIINALRHSWYSCLSFLHSLQLWQVALKRGERQYTPPRLTQGHVAFSGLELLTGGGYFSDSVMYYGYYSNSTLYKNCSISSSGMDQQPSHSPSKRTMETDCGVKLSYNMPLAYFFTIGGAFFITCIILVYSMSKSFGQSFRIDKSHGILAMKVFTSWDFKVIKKTSVKLRSENICTQLKELLEETNRKHVQKTVCQRIGRVTVHGLAWFICIGSTVACVLALYYFSEYMHKDLQYRSRIPTKDPLLKEASLLALPVVVSLINLLLPGLFNATAWMEEYDSPSVHTYVSISRNLMLKVSVLVVLCFHWLGRIASDPNSIGLQCWESFVGQELYRFLLMDFIFTILDTFFGEFLWRLFFSEGSDLLQHPGGDGQRKIISLLQEQIENEGEDKKFLITRLQAIHQQKPPFSPRRLTSQASQDSNG
ncbi:hypothetical protein J4Q44_G00289910 [Coregonus suidteri]|uniref:Transmembrane channel-like protein n=1 Tax=Coregonus suidteri TaxID=861788 RepID=A0AAN8KZD6_9TELE